MAQALVIPFKPSIAAYSFDASIADTLYHFEVHWNDFDQAWYFDLYDEDRSPIEENIKIVIGTYLGRTSNHKLFKNGIMTVIDTTGDYADAGFDDIGQAEDGQRVEVRYYTLDDLVNTFYSPGGA